MNDTHAPESDIYSAPQPNDAALRVQPSSSKMLSTYLADVEQMLDDKHWDLALRDALDLPQIAVALTDPRLLCTAEGYKAWCARWIRPETSADDSDDQHDRVRKFLGDRAEETAVTDSVPSNALRRLRLRRHARNAPRGFNSELVGVENPHATDAVEICTAVVDGVRRWYAHSACHDPTAQTNLARLAVLR